MPSDDDKPVVFLADDVMYAVAMLLAQYQIVTAVLQEPAESIPICSLCLRADRVSQECSTDDDAMLCCVDCGRCG